MVKNKSKFGFSLAETLVSMMVLAIFFGIAAKMVTQRPKREYVVNPHGFFECYLDGATLHENSAGKGDKTVTTETGCNHTPVKNTSVYNLFLVFNNGNNIYYRTLYGINYNIKAVVNTDGSIELTNSDGTHNIFKQTEFENWPDSDSYTEIDRQEFGTEVKLVNENSRIATVDDNDNVTVVKKRYIYKLVKIGGTNDNKQN